MRELVFALCSLTILGCQMTGSDDIKTEPELVTEDRPMAWFLANPVERVIEVHNTEQVFGLIALNRRGYFYPKVGMARAPLKMNEGCKTWLLKASNDVVSSEQEKENMSKLQAFATKFNMAMENKCLP